MTGLGGVLKQPVVGAAVGRLPVIGPHTEQPGDSVVHVAAQAVDEGADWLPPPVRHKIRRALGANRVPRCASEAHLCPVYGKKHESGTKRVNG